LRECDSYGISFVGFSDEVTGKLALDELMIVPASVKSSARKVTGRTSEVSSAAAIETAFSQ